MTSEEVLRLNEEVATAMGFVLERHGAGVAQAHKGRQHLVCCPYNANMSVPKESFFSPASDLTTALALFAEQPFIRLEKTASGFLAVMRVQEEPCYLVTGTGRTVQLAICKAIIAAQPGHAFVLAAAAKA